MRSTSFAARFSAARCELRRLSFACERRAAIAASRVISAFVLRDTFVPYAATGVLIENMREETSVCNCLGSTMRDAVRHRLECAGNRSVPADILTVILHFT
jgi:hypothetical protein